MTGIDELSQMAREEKSWFMRMAAANGLIEIKRDYDQLNLELEKKIASSNDPATTVELRKQQNQAMEILDKVKAELTEIVNAEENPRVKGRISKEID